MAVEGDREGSTWFIGFMVLVRMATMSISEAVIYLADKFFG